MQGNQRFAVVSLLEAVLGGVIAATIFFTYKFAPNQLVDSSFAVTIAGIGGIAVLYYLSVHQFLKKKYLKQSALVLTAISALNIVLVTLASGGLDSPYYALWLLAIVIAGLFGTTATIVAAGSAVLLYIYAFATNFHTPGYIVGHLGQLIITIAVAVVAEWIHITLGRNSDHHQQVAELSGQLDEEALKSNALMQSVGEGVLVVNAQRQIQLFNPAAVQLTGWDEHSAQGIDYRLVLNLHGADGEKLTDAADPFGEVWQSGKSGVHTDLTMQTKGGHSVAISLSVSPIYDANRKVSGGIALFRDISDEKEVARQKDEFVSTASHEMRTPVAAIEGYLSLAMNPAVATIDDRAKGYLEKAHNSTQHLGELFRDLLSITKMDDAAKMDVTQIFDLTALVKETVADMVFSAQKKNLELQFSTADESVRSQHSLLPIYAVKGNQQRLREVVMNLIENAIKFTPEGSIHVTIAGTPETVTVSVTDSGIGISPEDASHLFQKFYRIDSTATRTIGGTGLGLYLCRTIIELLGGRIWIESKLGEGSSFKFSLPRLASDSISTKDTPSPAPTPTAASAAPTPPAAATPVAVTTTAPAAPAPAVAAKTVSKPAEKPSMSDVRKPAGVK